MTTSWEGREATFTVQTLVATMTTPLAPAALLGCRRSPRPLLALAVLLALVVPGDSTAWDVQQGLSHAGPLEDAQCDVNAVEEANSKQLHSILEELANMTYFRLMHINLDGKCHFFNKAVAEAKCSAGAPPQASDPFASSFSPATGFSAAEESAPLCSLASGGDDSSTPHLASSESKTAGASGAGKRAKDQSASFEDKYLKNPLGLLGEWGDVEGPRPLTNPVDRTISDLEGKSLLEQKDEESCSNPLLPDFWLDICRNIPTNASEYVNLMLNPERWTGYNGSHVWNAIYHENCFAKMGDLEDMCYEERVLYRLLSGMHTSVNIHIDMAFFPPSKAKNRTAWTSNPQRFMDQYGDKPEFLKNLYFAFVVLLRAVRRAGPYLYNLPFKGSGSEDEARRTQYLVRRLLDSGLMTSCSSVFEAFDESLMFRAEPLAQTSPDLTNASPFMTDTSVSATLKSQWKGVFHNISQVMDCISCQKCRLHGKIQLLGIGTALKILLLPEQLISASIERSELVALFNTLSKFSSAIQAIPQLVDEYLDLHRTFKSDILTEKESPSREVPAAALFGRTGSEGGASAKREHRQVDSGSKNKRDEHKGGYGAHTIGADSVEVAWNAVDAGVAAVATASGTGSIDVAIEDAIIDGLLNREDDVLLLAKHYATSMPQRFLQHAVRLVTAPARTVTRSSVVGSSYFGSPGHGSKVADQNQEEDEREEIVDAVVIGGGLAGLSAALTILDAGGRVVLLEKMGHLGGNSAWASSGVNAVDVNDTKTGDSVDIFTSDVAKAAGRGDNPLIRVLTQGSVDSLSWLRSRLAENLNLDLVGQMGGHSKPRTHRPSSGLAGSAMIFALQKQVEKYMQQSPAGGRPAFELRKWTRATKLVTKGEAVVGVEYMEVTAKDQNTPVRTGFIIGRNVLIATGGYASDYQPDSLLSMHRPDLLKYATTNNKGTTGDGHKLALAIGAQGIDLDDVQVHPTGFHNPSDPTNKVKTLAAEITRGEGALLLHRGGGRFVNELGGRDYVTGRMLDVAKNAPSVFEADGTDGSLLYALVINGKGAQKTTKHIDLYTKKKLLTRYDSLKDLAGWSYWNASVSEATLRASFTAYDAAAKNGSDQWGKTFFHNTPFSDDPPYYAGLVTPVIHYCMGGLAISADGSVLRSDGSAIPGLFAAGEVIGGLHGKNRLGGNALSECVVFGRVIGNRIASSLAASREPAGSGSSAGSALGHGRDVRIRHSLADGPPPETPSPVGASEMDAPYQGTNASGVITLEELAIHNTENSCWVAIDGKVYDFTAFLDEHPAGAEAILKYGGQDGSDIFHAIHTAEMLEDFKPLATLAQG